TEQVELLAEALKKLNLPVKVFLDHGQPIRAAEATGTSSFRSRVLSNAAGLSEDLDNIRNSLNQGFYCLADHNYLSFLVELQSHDKNSSPQVINSLVEFVTDAKPDLTIVLDVDSSNLKEKPNEQVENHRAAYLL